MANLFTDDFNRANGAIGNNWVSVSGTWEVFSNYARETAGGTNHACIQPGFGSNPDVEVSVRILSGATASSWHGVTVRSSATWQDAYFARYWWVPTASQPRIEVYRRVGGVQTQLHTVWDVPDNTADHKLTWRASAGQHQILVDDVLFLSFTDDSIAGGSYAGMYAYTSGSRFDDFTVDSLPTVSLHVSPSTVPASSTDNILTLTSDAANWTPGTPGSPTFTCELGTITAQEVIDASTAQLTYDAPAYVATDTIHDPLNGTSVGLGIGQEIGGDITEVLRRLGAFPTGLDVYNYLKSVAIQNPITGEQTEPSAFFSDVLGQGWVDDFATYLSNIWTSLVSYPPVAKTNLTVNAANIASSLWARKLCIDILAALNAMTDSGNDTLRIVVNDIRGPYGTSISAIYDLILTLRTPSEWNLGDILTAIAGVRGVDNRHLTEIYNYLTVDLATVVAAIFDSLAEVRTGSNYTFQSVLDAISAVRGAGAPDLAAVLTAIAAVRGAGNPDLAAILAAIAAIQPTPTNDLDTITTQLTTIYSYLTTHLPAIESTLQDILDAIGGIPGGGGTPGAPIWPGLAGVTLGTPVAVSGDQSISGSMDGVIVALTSVPIRHKWYEVGGNVSWRRVGVLSFVSDAGDSEAPQYLSMTEQVYTVRQMEHGAGVLLHLPTGVAALVTPWTLNP